MMNDDAEKLRIPKNETATFLETELMCVAEEELGMMKRRNIFFRIKNTFLHLCPIETLFFFFSRKFSSIYFNPITSIERML